MTTPIPDPQYLPSVPSNETPGDPAVSGEKSSVGSTETVAVPTSEVSRPVGPEALSVAEVDHQTGAASQGPQNPGVSISAVLDPAAQSDDNQAATQATPPASNNPDALDQHYFKAVDDAIDQTEEKPYEEEEQAEDLNQGYLRDRFGKVIKKSD